MTIRHTTSQVTHVMSIAKIHSSEQNRLGLRVKLKSAATGAVFGLGMAMLLSQPVFAQVSRTKHIEVEGQVTALDQATRTVTVKDSGGTEQTFKVSPDVRNLYQIKVGDTINVDFTHSVLLELRAAEDLSATTSTEVNRAPTGGQPFAMGVERNTLTAKIIAVDVKHHSVTLQGPKGNQVVFPVKDANLRAKLSTLKPGQVIRASFTDAVAVSVTPSS